MYVKYIYIFTKCKQTVQIQYRGEIFELFMGPKSWVELTPPRGPAAGEVQYSGEDLIRLNSSEFKNLASVYTIQYTVHLVQCSWDLQKFFIPSQTLFWWKEHNFINLYDQTILQYLTNLILLMKHRILCIVRTVYKLHEPSQYGAVLGNLGKNTRRCL